MGDLPNSPWSSTKSEVTRDEKSTEGDESVSPVRPVVQVTDTVLLSLRSEGRKSVRVIDVNKDSLGRNESTTFSSFSGS